MALVKLISIYCRSLSDDELPTNDHLSNVMFSTPVSSQKPRREGGQLGKLKATRFALPSSIENKKKEPLRYIKHAVGIFSSKIISLIESFCGFRTNQQCRR